MEDIEMMEYYQKIIDWYSIVILKYENLNFDNSDAMCSENHLLKVEVPYYYNEILKQNQVLKEENERLKEKITLTYADKVNKQIKECHLVIDELQSKLAIAEEGFEQYTERSGIKYCEKMECKSECEYYHSEKCEDYRNASTTLQRIREV
jgi:hypothetical protein